MLRPSIAPAEERAAARPKSGSSIALPFTAGTVASPSAAADRPATLAPRAPAVRRHLSRESAHAIEILGHAIEYLADEWALDPVSRGYLGNMDPRVEAIQLLKANNREIYMSGTEVQPPLRRIRRWFLGERGS